MELLKRYVAASSMGAVALVCILIGLLGVTVLRPPSQQVSTVESATDLIMTRDNVLSIVKDDVTVTATSKSGAPVTLVIGTSQDAKGWIGNAAYTEVIGVEADRTKLKAESHAANGTGMVNPNAQNAVQSGAQPLDDPTSAQLTDQLAKSPMWFKQESGTGSVSLDLENVPSGRSAVAASAGGPGDLTFTLTWQVEQVNMLAIIAFLTAAFFALLAFALFLTRWQLLRLRKIRAQRIEERRKADTLDTSTINAAEVAEMVAAARESGSGAAPAPAVSEPPVAPPPAAEPAVDETAADEPVVADDDDDEAVAYMFEDAQSEEIEDSTQKQAAPAWGAAAFVSSTGQAPASDRTRDELSARDAAVREPLPLRSTRDKSIVRASIVGVPAPDISALSAPDYAPDPMMDTFERRGRHGLNTGPFDVDPPERATTDTGVIDLSGIRGGRNLPSRRALREARNNGEEVVVVDGQEFNTGLIPVTRPRTTEVQAPPPAPTSAPDDDASATGGWTSIMSGWLEDRQGEQ